jgi:hypothetical protein
LLEESATSSSLVRTRRRRRAGGLADESELLATIKLIPDRAEHELDSSLQSNSEKSITNSSRSAQRTALEGAENSGERISQNAAADMTPTDETSCGQSDD